MAPRPSLVVGGVLAAAVIGGLALYGTGSNLGNLAGLEPATPCADAAEAATRIAPLARGEVAAFEVATAPRPAPPLRFKGPDGVEIDLASLKGKALLVNLWAMWCAPCKAEMPALDRLQADLGGKRFQVVAINVDTRNLDKAPAWLKQTGIAHLAYYGDPEGRVLPLVQQHTHTTGLPTTMLVDAKGCEIGAVKGPAEWASEDAKRLIRAALDSAP